jgi:hypothetical protein
MRKPDAISTSSGRLPRRWLAVLRVVHRKVGHATLLAHFERGYIEPRPLPAGIHRLDLGDAGTGLVTSCRAPVHSLGEFIGLEVRAGTRGCACPATRPADPSARGGPPAPCARAAADHRGQGGVAPGRLAVPAPFRGVDTLASLSAPSSCDVDHVILAAARACCGRLDGRSWRGCRRCPGALGRDGFAADGRGLAARDRADVIAALGRGSASATALRLHRLSAGLHRRRGAAALEVELKNGEIAHKVPACPRCWLGRPHPLRAGRRQPRTDEIAAAFDKVLGPAAWSRSTGRGWPARPPLRHRVSGNSTRRRDAR